MDGAIVSGCWHAAISRKINTAAFVRIIVGVALALAAILLAMPASAWADGEASGADEPATAGAAKEALPYIVKSVSLDGVTYQDAVSANAGSRLYYRLAMTMPENVADLERLVYTAMDKPNAHIKLDTNSFTARVTGPYGATKKTLDVKVKGASANPDQVTISLGDLKKACPDIGFGDYVIVDYSGYLDSDVQPGEYPNVAKLLFDRGGGMEETVGVMALAKVSKPIVAVPEQTASWNPGTVYDKTGDIIGKYAPIALALLLVAIVAAIIYRRQARG